MIKKNNQGFTLIELLIVIVLIGILSGVLLSVIQPGAQRQRANETVMKANMDKLLMAVKACTSATKVPYTACDNNPATELGVNIPNGEPVSGTVYSIYPSTTNTTNIIITACLGGTYGTAPCGVTYCQIGYVYNTTTGIGTVTSAGGCQIDIPTSI
jgi:prepilin-type N-terminal cleavage/methylation domain-containing protein